MEEAHAWQRDPRLRAAFARLPEHYREVLELRLMKNLTADQAAIVLRATPGVVRVTQHRAIAELKRLRDA